jgi:hypothetical protein
MRTTGGMPAAIWAVSRVAGTLRLRHRLGGLRQIVIARDIKSSPIVTECSPNVPATSVFFDHEHVRPPNPPVEFGDHWI